MCMCYVDGCECVSLCGGGHAWRCPFALSHPRPRKHPQPACTPCSSSFLIHSSLTPPHATQSPPCMHHPLSTLAHTPTCTTTRRRAWARMEGVQTERRAVRAHMMPLPTHSQIHTHMHARTHTLHTHTHSHNKHTCTLTQHTYMHTHTQHTHTRVHTRTHTRAHTHTHTHTHTHARTRVQAHLDAGGDVCVEVARYVELDKALLADTEAASTVYHARVPIEGAAGLLIGGTSQIGACAPAQAFSTAAVCCLRVRTQGGAGLLIGGTSSVLLLGGCYPLGEGGSCVCVALLGGIRWCVSIPPLWEGNELCLKCAHGVRPDSPTTSWLPPAPPLPCAPALLPPSPPHAPAPAHTPSPTCLTRGCRQWRTGGVPHGHLGGQHRGGAVPGARPLSLCALPWVSLGPACCPVLPFLCAWGGAEWAPNGGPRLGARRVGLGPACCPVLPFLCAWGGAEWAPSGGPRLGARKVGLGPAALCCPLLPPPAAPPPACSCILLWIKAWQR